MLYNTAEWGLNVMISVKYGGLFPTYVISWAVALAEILEQFGRTGPGRRYRPNGTLRYWHIQNNSGKDEQIRTTTDDYDQ